MSDFKAIIKVIRPHQWIKNFFLFAGIVFSGRFFDSDALFRSSLGFIAFCALASGVYIFNDIKDAKADRAHPDKRNRPIASGQLTIPTAVIVGILLLALGSTVSFFLGAKFLIYAAGYIGLQILYIFVFKNAPILDILCVAAGFVIRAAAGGAVIAVPISSWLLVCTSLLALFLVTEKRRQELARIETENENLNSRPSLSNYTVPFLDQLASIEVMAACVAYMLYVFSPETAAKYGFGLGATIPFVFYGMFRYLWLVHRKNIGESPTKIFLTDIPSILNLIFWAIVVFIVVYFS